MSRGPRVHDERLELRLPSRAKRLLQEAATAQGLSLSAFLLQSGLLSARQSLGLPAGAWLPEDMAAPATTP